MDSASILSTLTTALKARPYWGFSAIFTIIMTHANSGGVWHFSDHLKQNYNHLWDNSYKTVTVQYLTCSTWLLLCTWGALTQASLLVQPFIFVFSNSTPCIFYRYPCGKIGRKDKNIIAALTTLPLGWVAISISTRQRSRWCSQNLLLAFPKSRIANNSRSENSSNGGRREDKSYFE